MVNYYIMFVNGWTTQLLAKNANDAIAQCGSKEVLICMPLEKRLLYKGDFN